MSASGPVPAHRFLRAAAAITLLLAGAFAAAGETNAETAAGAAECSADGTGHVRRPLGDVFAAGELLVHDAVTVFGSPFHTAFWSDGRAVTVLAIGGLLFWGDADIDEWSQRTKNKPGWRQLREVGEYLEPVGLMGNTNIYFAGGAVVGYAVDWPRVQLICGEILYANLVGGLIRDVSEVLLGRRRPNEGQGARAFEFRGGTSLPSGHTSTVFTLAEILSHHVQRRWATALFYGCAGTVGMQRVTSRSHWASDVWIAAALGVAVARVVTDGHERGRFDFGLVLAPDGQGPAVAVRGGF